MSMLDLFRRDPAGVNTPDRAAIIARYQRLRSVGRNLNHKMVQRLSKDVLYEGGKRLGILQRGTLVFNSEDETAVLMDYCIYNVRRNGRNAVEQYLADSAPDPQSDEMACLRAMQRARYSLFLVESVERGFGVAVRDLFYDDSLFIVDIGFGDTAKPGLLLASRVLFHEEFAITGGAGLPLGVLPEEKRQTVVQMLSRGLTPDEGGQFDPAPLIRECLSHDCSSHIQYQEPSGKLMAGHRRAPARLSSASPDPDRLCPCGSGRKAKNCCRKRRG